jgi:hypothetical protein
MFAGYSLLAAWGVAGLLLVGCNAMPSGGRASPSGPQTGGPLWVSPAGSETCAPIGAYRHSVWGTHVRNDSSQPLTIISVAPVRPTNVEVRQTYLIAFDREEQLLVQTLPLKEGQLGPWADRVDAAGATLEATEPPSIALHIVLDIEVASGAREAAIDALTIIYRDAAGSEYEQTTHQSLRYSEEC